MREFSRYEGAEIGERGGDYGEGDLDGDENVDCGAKVLHVAFSALDEGDLEEGDYAYGEAEAEYYDETEALAESQLGKLPDIYDWEGEYHAVNDAVANGRGIAIYGGTETLRSGELEPVIGPQLADVFAVYYEYGKDLDKERKGHGKKNVTTFSERCHSRWEDAQIVCKD